MRFGSTTVYSAPMLAPSPTLAYSWDLQTLSFVATAPTQELSFLARSVDAVEPVYLGVDLSSRSSTERSAGSTGRIVGPGALVAKPVRDTGQSSDAGSASALLPLQILQVDAVELGAVIAG